MAKDSFLDIGEEIKQSVLSYVRTAQETNDTEFDLERERFLRNSETSPVFTAPLFELLPRYVSSDRSLSDFLTDLLKKELPDHGDEQLNDLVEIFENLGIKNAFLHQEEATTTSVEKQNHTVITTGTGSGKTNCFLLPMLLTIFAEALGSKGRKAWTLAESQTQPHWWEKDPPEYKPTRIANRDTAVRAILVYPLNALVQDQIEQLREILHSDQAERFYERHLGGDRVFFGQYNGDTRGKRSEGARKTAEFLNKLTAQAETVTEQEEKYVQQPGRSEMLLRREMQELPPDILITNFTMLSIMLIRDEEKGIWEKTRKWLKASKDNVLYLVLDELHSYRGTGGTEISYTIRQLLSALGLTPTDNQLRIVCTSASLEETENSESDPEFLCDFFGTDKGQSAFSIIKGATVNRGSPVDLSNLADPFKKYWLGESAPEIESRLKQISTSRSSENDPDVFEAALHGLTAKIRARQPLSSELASVPFTIDDLANEFFGGCKESALGLIKFAIEPSSLNGSLSVKLRQHIFLKNLQGIRRAMRISNGSLNSIEILDCSSSFSQDGRSIALDCLYCQVCGELFYRGHFREGRAQGTGSMCVDDLANQGQNHVAIINFGDPFDEDTDTKERWERRIFDGASGQIHPNISKEKPAKETEAEVSFILVNPKEPQVHCCPACGTDWRTRPHIKTPLRTMGTGYQKASQIITEQVMKGLSRGATRPKTIVFSDSRRSASELAAELELNHFRDSIRAHTEEILFLDPKEMLDSFDEFLGACKAAYQKNSFDEIDNHSFAREQREIADSVDRAIRRFQNDEPRLTAEIQRIRAPLLEDRIEVDTIAAKCFEKLVEAGISPSGVERDLTDRLHWPVILKEEGEKLREEEKDALLEMRTSLKDEVRRVITDSTGRDFESLGLGWITFTRPTNSRADGTYEADVGLMDTIIRFLSFYYKTRNQYASGCELLPEYFTNFINESFPARFSGLSRAGANKRIKDLFEPFNIIYDDFRLRLENLSIQLPGAQFWRCDTCRGIHLFNGSGRCRTVKYRNICPGTLVEHPIEELKQRKNYYFRFKDDERHKLPLRVAELVGHTDSEDQRERQLLFQDIRIGETSKILGKKESEKLLSIDVLSVTTTMEAGVDIGGLRAVIMANMPPRRFNYQQRVGRAGRRQDKLSLAVTFCRGQKHDEYYFANPLLMVGERTAPPKLDPSSLPIARRIATKHIFTKAFSEVDELKRAQKGSIQGDRNSGNFGNLGSAKPNLKLLKNYVNTNQEELLADLKALLSKEILDASEKLYSAVIQDIEEIGILSDEWINKYGRDLSLSEAMALEGFLPLYGMPIRSTALVHSNPYSKPNNGEFPIKKGVIDRSEDIAIAEFAPLQEVVKDKQIYSCAGVAWFTKDQGSLVATDPPPGNRRDFQICTFCQIILKNDEVRCSSCNEDSLLRAVGWRPTHYITHFRGTKPFDGFTESNPQKVLYWPVDQKDGDPQSWQNCTLRSSTGSLLRVNTNDDQGFQFSRLDRGRYANTFFVGDRTIGFEARSSGSKLSESTVLYSEQFTDFGDISFSETPMFLQEGFSSREKAYAVHSAWESAAELLKTAIVQVEDIEESEIAAEVQLRSKDWHIFIADTLDNGAGYSTKYVNSESFQTLIHYLENTVIKEFLNAEPHASSCVTSCYKCLRSYENRRKHAKLNWRLGIDLIRLLSNSSGGSFNFGVHWENLLSSHYPARLSTLLSRRPIEVAKSNGLFVYKVDNAAAIVPWHPFLGAGPLRDRTMVDIQDELSVGRVAVLDPVNFSNSPMAEFQRLREMMQRK